MLDGVVLARKTGLGALRRPVLVALRTAAPDPAKSGGCFAVRACIPRICQRGARRGAKPAEPNPPECLGPRA